MTYIQEHLAKCEAHGKCPPLPKKPPIVIASPTGGKAEESRMCCLIKGFVSMFRKDRLVGVKSEPPLLRK